VAGPVVITGGGTGGHVFPMQAIAEALLERGVSARELRFVGSRRGQEAELLAGGEVALTLLPGRGLRRSMRGVDLARNLGAALGLARAFVLAKWWLRRWRPSVVVSVGGYASLALSAAAVLGRRPLVLVEFDAAPGASLRIFRRFAVARCCAFPTPGANVVVTGAPLRASIESVDRSLVARERAKALAVPPIEPARAVVVVMTGSLGAGRVNAAVRELAVIWSDRRDRTLIHVTGRRDYLEYLSMKPETRALDYRVVAFGDMAELWSLADVAICRAGALTIAELTALSIPSVLVPLPGAPHDHQTKNALAVVGVGGATMVRDEACSGAALAERLEAVMERDELATMARAAGTLARPHAAEAIADVVLDARAAS
jgi:UDP-N-acetylglucosamine--N-acetylmuramyl-(pentapeptide) pyrophosphoryl-undecaprenol N-acetylglucosamine transferase